MPDNSYSHFASCRIEGCGTTPIDSMPKGAIFTTTKIRGIEPIAKLNKLSEDEVVFTEHVDFSHKD